MCEGMWDGTKFLETVLPKLEDQTCPSHVLVNFYADLEQRDSWCYFSSILDGCILSNVLFEASKSTKRR